MERVREELGKERFGMLTEIDVKATLKKKPDVDSVTALELSGTNEIRPIAEEVRAYIEGCEVQAE